MDQQAAVQGNLANAQFGAMPVTPVATPRSDTGANFGRQANAQPTRTQSAGAFNYGLQNRLTMWQAPQGAALGSTNLGSNINFGGDQQYQPVEMK